MDLRHSPSAELKVRAAYSMRVVRAALLYFVLVFSAGFALGLVRVPFVVHAMSMATELPRSEIAIAPPTADGFRSRR